ncbi:MAG: dihydropteroate synthase [Zetaproteobacteria bacterium CG_4_9_14_3_um_filter_49_83]|nr:MAG: dihydropteroate synthase [Zetaproteobacteria bacterium CG1_02_49_23]PIQ34079.1 MAG: dihydropteroate synthase [Zetaproteobacteria bacterium CG17_big_fil_post_rev_8_21_14_2_50_50_13]PIV30244.1 MAG: dihydropteroate synthase [Zetaproteobacteria bacterium CG02_land_8_20_14_3_00_50_9]PIY55873.1 MAG: dihydropteroate synthase [Zetaproteobacteria bacterium CG_4_10_14_0_8_um_filter_49_80]PJA35003.1 MAG: dihydropteroate synthase [Zetaproteobacteria bacterium CG_4_9_14_3_um_filter_49_83]
MARWLCKAGQPAWIMGVLNCTPDSFSDGGVFFQGDENASAFHVDAAIAHAVHLRQQGADLIDVGGESTRPGAMPVSVGEELRRVVPVIQGLVGAGCQVSVDTMKAEVMHRSVLAGASMINDVSALSHDPASLEVAAGFDVDICLMHMQGSPATMQKNPQYTDVVDDVCHFFSERLEACAGAGVDEQRLLLDPGIGFGKRFEDNLALIAGLPRLKQEFGLPVLMGVSRKSFLGAITHAVVDDREIETAAAVSACVMLGADMLRVHDVARQLKAVRVASVLRDSRC